VVQRVGVLWQESGEEGLRQEVGVGRLSVLHVAQADLVAAPEDVGGQPAVDFVNPFRLLCSDKKHQSDPNIKLINFLIPRTLSQIAS
jgi:hypothetical protein